MKLISQIITVIYCSTFITTCSNVKGFKVPYSNKIDTLKIGFLDTALTGNQLFPTTIDSNNLKDLVDEKVLLSFESGNYYYVFYNKKNKLDILSDTYWEQQMPQYINFIIEDGLLSYTRYIMVNYYDPFLTGFYNSKDSIIIQTSNLRASDFKNIDQLYVNYFSTTDTLMKVNKNISVGSSLEYILFELQIPNDFKPKKEFELVLMEATTQVDNAWYVNYPDNCSDYSVTVILSIKNNKLTRIQYLNLEYIDYVLKQKKILTKNIHYH